MNQKFSLCEFEQSLIDVVKPDSTRGYGSFSYAGKNLKAQLDYFNTGNGICYFSKRIRSNGMLQMYDDNPFACSFLLFNAGCNTPASFDLKKPNKRIDMHPQELWIGNMQAGFNVEKDYCNQQCFEQGIVLNQQLAKDLGGLKNLQPIHDNTSIKQADLHAIQKLLFKQIQHANFYQNKLQEIFIEHKILELVHGSFFDKKTLKSNDRDSEIAEQARQIIITDLQNPPSISALAGMCATNEFKLKNVFKQHFNVTVYTMVQQERMKLAKILLQKNDISVSEAADLVGYKSLSHFSKVFQQYYGVLPSELKKDITYFLL